MKTRILLVTVMLAAGAACRLDAQQYENRFNSGARMHDYVHALIGPSALLGIAAGTALDQIRDDPPQWNIGNRALSNAGRLAVQESVHHGLAAIMNRSTWYYPCSCTGTGARIAHAFGEAFTDHDVHGRTYLSVARIAGAYGGAYAESTWRPGRSGGEVIVAGTSSLVGSAVLNLWREFVH